MLKIVENLWAVGALPQTPLRSSQRSPRPLAGGEGLLPHKNPTPALGPRPFSFAPMKTPGLAVASRMCYVAQELAAAVCAMNSRSMPASSLSLTSNDSSSWAASASFLVASSSSAALQPLSSDDTMILAVLRRRTNPPSLVDVFLALDFPLFLLFAPVHTTEPVRFFFTEKVQGAIF